MRVHSRREQRYRCTICHQTFTATKDTPFYRLRTSADMVTLVLTLLSHGCPIQAIVAAFGFDERTVAAWLTRAGQHCQRVHQHVVQQKRVDLQHVQADELWVKLVGRRVWMAMALAVPFRLWLGGVISPHRDLRLITALVQLVRSCGRSLAILVCVDGLASYVTACLHVFRDPVRTGRRGRPRLVLEKGLLLGQVVKRYVQRRVVSVERRGVRGTAKGSVANFDFRGKIRKSAIGNLMTYRDQNSRKSKFATEPTAVPLFPLGGDSMFHHIGVLTRGTTNLEAGHGDLQYLA